MWSSSIMSIPRTGSSSPIPGACQRTRPAVQRERKLAGNGSQRTSPAVRSRRSCDAAKPSPEFHRGRDYFSTVISQSEFAPLRFPNVVSVFSKLTWANLARYAGTSPVTHAGRLKRPAPWASYLSFLSATRRGRNPRTKS